MDVIIQQDGRIQLNRLVDSKSRYFHTVEAVQLPPLARQVPASSIPLPLPMIK
jgi:hypothetical protein